MNKPHLKKILVISPAPSHPQNAGNRSRIFSMLSTIKEMNHEIHFLYYDHEGNSTHVLGKPDKKAMRKCWDKFFYIPKASPELIEKLWKGIYFASKGQLAGTAASSSTKSMLFFSKLAALLKFRRYLSPYHLFMLWGKFFLYCQESLYNVSEPLYHFAKARYQTIKPVFSSCGHLIFGGKLSADKINTVTDGQSVSNEPISKDLPSSVIKKYENGNTFSIDAWYNTGLDYIIKKLDQLYHYDLVIVEYVFMSRALLNFGEHVVKFIDTHDIFTDRHAIYEKKGLSDTFFSTTREEEAIGLDRADIVVAIQDKEREKLKGITNKTVETIGHKVRLVPPIGRAPNRMNILYIGPGNSSNIQGIKHFIGHVLPRVREHIPSVKLVLAGAICKDVDNNPGCIKLGEVREIDEAYDIADVVINPVIVGTGLKIKNVEAMGFSKPLVTTSYCAEGLEQQSDAFVVADTDESFSRSLVKVLTDTDLYNRLSNKAYAYATEYNKTINEKLGALIGASERIC